MRSRLRHVMLVCLATTACEGLFDPDFPPAAIPVAAPPQYRVWWEVVEACSGRQASFDAVGWFKVPVGHLTVRGEPAAGAWFVSGNRIAITQGWEFAELVRHEMLHAILQTGSHPTEFFRERCGAEVICGWNCPPRPSPPDAIEVSIDVLEVDAVMYPQAPSITAQDGKATVVVRVHNPANGNVFVRAERFGEARCGIGFLIASASEPGWSELGCGYLDTSDNYARIFFRPGESRHLVFEVDLRTPTYGGPLHAGTVTLTAILADNFRKTTASAIRP